MFKLGVLAVCLMNNFTDLPPKIKGEIVVELKSYVTIAVKSKDKKETVELTFPKDKCTKEKK